VFRDFALRADFADAGESAANETLGVGLGELVASVLDLDPEQTPGPALALNPPPPTLAPYACVWNDRVQYRPRSTP
jgi:hypothetical protein